MKYFAKYLPFFMLVLGCDAEEGPIDEPVGDYFPLVTGTYYVYDVSERHYNMGSEPSLLNYEVRMEVVDSFPSNQGQFTYVLNRSQRQLGSALWKPLDTWSARKDGKDVVVTEGNVPFVKIRYPIRAETRWDGNILNVLGVDEYAYEDLDASIQLNGLTFEETLTVEQERNEDVIVFMDTRREIFSRNVGLIYKEVVQLNYCTDDPCLGQQKVDHGMEMEMTIKSYGKN